LVGWVWLVGLVRRSADVVWSVRFGWLIGWLVGFGWLVWLDGWLIVMQ